MLIEEEDAQSEKKPLQEWLLLFSAYIVKLFADVIYKRRLLRPDTYSLSSRKSLEVVGKLCSCV